MSIVPKSRPQASLNNVVNAALSEWAKDIGDAVFPSFFMLGARGYYLDSMGKKGENDRGIYDDAIFIVAGNCFVSFNANVDPSIFKKGIASLIDGVHWYRKGLHGISKPNPKDAYPAFVPASRDKIVRVTRDGEEGIKEGIALNVHKGSYSGTSSLGCQTIHPSQWDSFYGIATRMLDESGNKIFPYILTSKKVSL